MTSQDQSRTSKRTGVIPYLQHIWCHLGPLDYEHVELEETVGEEITSEVWICSRCGHPLHRLTGPIRVGNDE